MSLFCFTCATGEKKERGEKAWSFASIVSRECNPVHSMKASLPLVKAKFNCIVCLKQASVSEKKGEYGLESRKQQWYNKHSQNGWAALELSVGNAGLSLERGSFGR